MRASIIAKVWRNCNHYTTSRRFPFWLTLLTGVLLTGAYVVAQQPPVMIYGVTETTGVPRPVTVNASGQLVISASISGVGDGAIEDGVTPSIQATVFDLTNSNPLAAQIVDANGTAITSFGGGVQYTEADVDTTITGTAIMYETNTGTSALGVVNATDRLPVVATQTGTWNVTNAGTFAVQAAQSGTWTVQPGNTANTTAWLVTGGLTNNGAAPSTNNFGALTVVANAAAPSWTEGRLVALSSDLAGALRIAGAVSCSNCTGSGASDVEGSTFALGTDSLAPAGFYFDDTAPTAATEDRIVLARVSGNRSQYIQIRDGANNERGALVTAQNELLVELGAGTASVGIVDTEMPTAVALANGTANPTVPGVAAFIMGFNGTTWDRAQLATDWTISSPIGTTAPGQNLEAKDFDGAALPLTAAAAEGDAIPMAGSLYGITYTMLVSEDGALQYGTTTTPFVVGDGAGAFNVIIDSGTITSLSQLGGVALPIEDAPETAAGVGIYSMSVRRDVAVSSAGTTGDNATLNTDAIGLIWARHLDPCTGIAKTHIPINIVTATTTELTPSLAGSSNNYYVCSIDVVSAGASNVALVDDDTDGCGSVTSGLAGGTTAATGWNFGANGGLTKGNGEGTVFKTGGTNRVVCLVTSAATQVSGSIQVVAAP